MPCRHFLLFSLSGKVMGFGTETVIRAEVGIRERVGLVVQQAEMCLALSVSSSPFDLCR